MQASKFKKNLEIRKKIAFLFVFGRSSFGGVYTINWESKTQIGYG